MQESVPTIKGIFVKSHIRTLQNELGNEGLAELERRYGKKIAIKNSDSIPIAEEVKIIEISLDLLFPELFTEEQRSFEAGRLHFRNFSSTPFGKILFSVFKGEFKLMMLKAKNVAGHVFKGVKFSSEALDDCAIKLSMEQHDYSIEHFRGLFYEWMHYSGLSGTVEASQPDANRYEYVMRWNTHE